MNAIETILNITEDKYGRLVKAVVHNAPIIEREKNGHYFIQCPLFKTVGHSTISVKDAEIDHQIDFEIFFKAHEKRGTLKEALNSLGWSAITWRQGTKKRYRSPEISAHLSDRARSKRISVAA